MIIPVLKKTWKSPTESRRSRLRFLKSVGNKPDSHYFTIWLLSHYITIIKIIKHISILFWLVVWTPLKNMSSSVGIMTFPTEWKVIKFMFQTTNQILVSQARYWLTMNIKSWYWTISHQYIIYKCLISSNGKSPFLMGKFTISMANFNSYAMLT